MTELGLEHCIEPCVHGGFYTSMDALRGATYEELVDSGVRPVHAKLILSNLGSRHQVGSPLPPATAHGDDASDEIKHFLRSIGLENCATDLAAANYRTLDQLGEASMHDLLNAGLKPVHARLISSNLDNPSSVTLHMTPAAQRLASMEAEETLLPGGPSKRRRPRYARLLCYGALLVMLILGAAHMLSGTSAVASPPGPAPSSAAATASDDARRKGLGKGSGEGKHKADAKHKNGVAGGEVHGKGGGQKVKPSRPM